MFLSPFFSKSLVRVAKSVIYAPSYTHDKKYINIGISLSKLGTFSGKFHFKMVYDTYITGRTPIGLFNET